MRNPNSHRRVTKENLNINLQTPHIKKCTYIENASYCINNRKRRLSNMNSKFNSTSMRKAVIFLNEEMLNYIHGNIHKLKNRITYN